MAAPRSSCRVAARRPSRPATISPIATASARPCSKAFSGWPPLPISWWSKAPASAEVNLRDGDLANMGSARAANVPVILIGDIHRGGVIASLVGTFVVLDPSDAALIRAFLVNNFHGDPSLFDDGRKFIESRTGVPCLGVIPHWNDARKLPAEDSLALDNHRLSHEGPVRIAVLRLARIANFDDLDPLMLETSITVEFVQPGAAAGARRRRDHSRNQIDDRRSALPARAGLGHRYSRPSQARRPGAWPVWRLPDARPAHS